MESLKTRLAAELNRSSALSTRRILGEIFALALESQDFELLTKTQQANLFNEVQKICELKEDLEGIFKTIKD